MLPSVRKIIQRTIHAPVSWVPCLGLLLVACPPVNAQITLSVTEPGESRHVSMAQPDVIQKMHVHEGQYVQAGQVLAELDTAVLIQQLAIAQLKAKSQAAIRAAKTRIRIREKVYQRLLPMLKAGHANPAEVDSAEADLEQARSDLELAQEKIKEAILEVKRIQAEIGQRQIRSPIDGYVTEIHVQPGEFVATESRKVVSVVNVNHLKARFYLTAAQVASLKTGQTIELLYGFPDAKQDRTPIRGELVYVSPVTDPDSGTCRVDVRINNKQKRLRSGTPCQWKGPVRSGSPSVARIFHHSN